MALLLRRTPQLLRLRSQYRCASSSKPTPQDAARQASAARDVARQRRTAAEQVDRVAKEQADKDYKKRYNTAARKWVSTIIAIPIMLVTSYYLFDRCRCTSIGNQIVELSKYSGVEERAEEMGTKSRGAGEREGVIYGTVYNCMTI